MSKSSAFGKSVYLTNAQWAALRNFLAEGYVQSLIDELDDDNEVLQSAFQKLRKVANQIEEA